MVKTTILDLGQTELAARPNHRKMWPMSQSQLLLHAADKPESVVGKKLEAITLEAVHCGGSRLCVVKIRLTQIRLTQSVYAWTGLSAPLFNRPGGVEQVYLLNLYERGRPQTSAHARVESTYWLKF